MATQTDPYNANYNYAAPQGGGDVQGFNPDLTSTFGTQNQNSQNFNSGQLGTIGGFQNAYQSATNALPSYQKLLTDANQQYNVQPLAQNAANLQNTVSQIPQTYSRATQGSDTNNNQLMQLIGQKQWELTPLAQAATNQAQTAQGLANNMVNYGVQNESFLTQPYQTAAPMVQSALASASSNFGAQQQAELAALTAKMQSGVTLTTDERDNLNRLQVAQKAYDQAVQVAKTTGQYSLQQQQLANQFQNVAPGNTLFNTGNGTYQRAA